MSVTVSPPAPDLTGIEIPDSTVPITGLKLWQITKVSPIAEEPQMLVSKMGLLIPSNENIVKT